jgi:hypothetical protein
MTITLAAIVIVIAAVIGATGLGVPRAFRNRTCQGRAWQKSFPQASSDEIREFLSLFVGAFAFPNADRLKFEPSDRVLTIYRAINPSNLKLAEVWRDELSLGEIFALARESRE